MGSGNEERSEGTYGPWIMVAHKRNGTKNRVAGRSPMEQMRDQAWRGPALSGNGIANDVGKVQPNHSTGKDAKRKISPSKDFNGPNLASSLQRLSKMTESWAKLDAGQSPDNMGVEKQVDWIGPGNVKQVIKPNRNEPLQRDSVKGKKALVRARALINSSGTSRAAKGNFFSLNHLNQGRSTQSCDGNQGNQMSSDFQFTAAVCPEMAVQFEGRDYRSESELKQGLTGMEVATTELNGIDSMENEATGVLSEGKTPAVQSLSNRLGSKPMAALVSLQVVLQEMELGVLKLGVMPKLLKRRGWTLREEAMLLLAFEGLLHVRSSFSINNECYSMEL